MGLLIKLQDGDTALKSLKFGNDRPGGGDSGQPYIKNPIEGTNSPINKDFLLRGGINTPLDAAEDVARLTKYFFDFRNPSGLLFTAKQNLLSRVSPKTEASKGAGYANGLINAGVYTPLSTLAEAGVVAFGGHLNKQGIDPTGLSPSLSINKYQDVITSTQLTGRIDLENNRLIKLTQNISQNKASGLGFIPGYYLNKGESLISYSGGSDSTLGIGSTNIKFATDNTGVPVKTLFPSFKPKTYQAEGKSADSIEQSKFQIPIKATEAYIYALPNLNLTSLEKSGQYLVSDGRNSYQYNFNNSVYKESGSLESRIDVKTYLTENPRQPENDLFIIPTGSSSEYKKYTGKTILTGLINPSGSDSFQLDYNTSVYTSGTLEPRPNIGSYLTRSYDIIQRSNDELENKPYFSPINEKLKSFGRQLVTDSQPQLDSGYYEAIDPSGSAVLGRYSSENTLATDKRLIGTGDLEKVDLLNAGATGYLANLNKNAGTYVNKDGNTVVQQSNPPRDGGGRGISVDFRKVNRDVRGFYDDPKAYDYISKSSEYNENTALDTKVYYKSSQPGEKRTSQPINNGKDLISFKIGITSPTSIKQSKDLQFKAYIDQFSDTYSNEWKSQTYMGRAEKQYKYNSFDRSISLGFTVVADNEKNLNEMYVMLNTLAASIAPTYTTKGYMAGNLHRLTLGNYLYEQWGIMNGGFTYEITEESPWSIDSGKQLPYYIRVTGVKFTPIHTFRPDYEYNNVSQYINQK
jgi:hypothetical protein